MAFQTKKPPIRIMVDIDTFNNLVELVSIVVQEGDERNSKYAEKMKDKLLKYSIPRVDENGETNIAITVTGMLSVIYLLFSFIQIFYLFIGNMELPEGYTYAAYARQGFFQLLAVCIINLFLVLLCLHFFKDNLILKIILTVISGCTFIMILSSALRMFMYIATYNLTFLRFFVIWSLVVIFLLMTGITIYIYFQRFPLFFYSVAVVTVFYIGLSFSHPDYWIARYNLNPAHTAYTEEYNTRTSDHYYLSTLSADAAPILLNEESNPYYTPDNMEASWMYDYCRRMGRKSDHMGIRNFNFSIFYTKNKVDKLPETYA